jgi:hypothetical protein
MREATRPAGSTQREARGRRRLSSTYLLFARMSPKDAASQLVLAIADAQPAHDNDTLSRPVGIATMRAFPASSCVGDVASMAFSDGSFQRGRQHALDAPLGGCDGGIDGDRPRAAPPAAGACVGLPAWRGAAPQSSARPGRAEAWLTAARGHLDALALAFEVAPHQPIELVRVDDEPGPSGP